ncbi:MAG: ATP-dependent Clp protease adaptor ClpS [Treponema sp.]|nr:ATP-dependent Clp protease adaptor ClpS [Candidatus Treponema caballi]
MAWKFDESTIADHKVTDETAFPADYKVILFNDDFTTKDFVVDILVTVFHKNVSAAVALMETVHKNGAAVVGVYAFDIASTLADRVVKDARNQGFPLRCELEVA